MMGALAVVAAYLIGGIPFGLIIVKLMTGADVRESGSGNIGATNVLRTTGPGAAILTLVLDAAKAWFAVWLAQRLSGGSELWMSFAALAALAGHAWSIWLKFKGGKAVASFVGAYAYPDAPAAPGRRAVICPGGGLDALPVSGIDRRRGAVPVRLLDDPASRLARTGLGGGRGCDHHRPASRQHRPHPGRRGTNIIFPPIERLKTTP